MLFGKNPFIPFITDTKKTIKMKDFKNCLRNKVIFPFEVSDAAKDLIQRMLLLDSTKRCTFEEFFCHPWFNDDNAD